MKLKDTSQRSKKEKLRFQSIVYRVEEVFMKLLLKKQQPIREE